MTTQSVKVTKTAQELIYSVSNAIRILGCKYNGIKIQVWFNCIYVWAKGQVSRFVAKAQFRHQFVNFRKQGAMGLNVQQVPFEDGEFLVGSSTGETAYLVQCLTDKLVCTCQDYQTQAAVMKKACCKHCYATLNHLGFGSLAEYVSPGS